MSVRFAWQFVVTHAGKKAAEELQDLLENAGYVVDDRQFIENTAYVFWGEEELYGARTTAERHEELLAKIREEFPKAKLSTKWKVIADDDWDYEHGEA